MVALVEVQNVHVAGKEGDRSGLVGVWDLGGFDLRATESQSLIMWKW